MGCLVCRLPRFLVLTVGIVAVPIAMAWSNPSLSERAFALTGATGVCIVCYIIPVVVHFMLLFQRKAPPSGSMLSTPAQNGGDGPAATATAAQPLLDSEGLQNDETEEVDAVSRAVPKPYAPRPETLWEWAGQALVPALVLLVGVGLSALSLVSSLRPPDPPPG